MLSSQNVSSQNVSLTSFFIEMLLLTLERICQVFVKTKHSRAAEPFRDVWEVAKRSSKAQGAILGSLKALMNEKPEIFFDVEG